MTDDIILDFSNAETDQQDYVDNLIQNLFEALAGCEGAEIEWNIEYIEHVRTAIQDILVDELEIMTEQEFYPYREYPFVETDISKDGLKEGIEYQVDRQTLEEVVVNVLSNDMGYLALWAGIILGGKCRHIVTTDEGNDIFGFTPNSHYNGILDNVRLIVE